MNAYDIITTRIIELLESGTVPWRKPWLNGAAKNLVSGKEYRGINSLLLGCSAYSSPYWATFNQIKARGGFVRKGEKGAPVLFFRVLDKDDENARERRFPLARHYTVFNTEQSSGLDVPATRAFGDVDPIEACEGVIKSYPNPPSVRHGEARAYYAPSIDTVNMPSRALFESSEAYYSTLFHELSHSTGHASRLGRQGVTDSIAFGSHAYSKEELIAEMGASFLAGETGIAPATLDNSAAYISAWLKRLRDDRKLVIEAAAQAQKAADWIRGRQKQASPDLPEEQAA